jgi:hypothetical protein
MRCALASAAWLSSSLRWTRTAPFCPKEASGVPSPQAVHREDTVAELSIAAEILGRAGEDDLTVRLQRDPHRPLLGVCPDRLADETASSKGRIQPAVCVEPGHRDLPPDATADQDLSVPLHGDAAGGVVADEGGEDTTAVAEGRIARAGDAGRQGDNRERGNQSHHLSVTSLR